MSGRKSMASRCHLLNLLASKLHSGYYNNNNNNTHLLFKFNIHLTIHSIIPIFFINKSAQCCWNNTIAESCLLGLFIVLWTTFILLHFMYIYILYLLFIWQLFNFSIILNFFYQIDIKQFILYYIIYFFNSLIIIITYLQLIFTNIYYALHSKYWWA